jgi:hypothetical protein
LKVAVIGKDKKLKIIAKGNQTLVANNTRYIFEDFGKCILDVKWI